MAQTLADIAKILNIGKSHVQNPIRKIFLCGGPNPKVGESPTSLRGFLIAHLEEKNDGLPSYIVLAEEAVKWYHSLSSNRFSNLVDLEIQIAALSTLVLLIVESPGSMTELGAFSFVDSLRKKLYVVLESRFQYDQSFILDGPIAKIRSEIKAESDPNRFYTCDWLSQSDGSSIDVDRAKLAAQQIVEDILDPAINGSASPERFDKKNVGHQMLLIADLVSLGGALRPPEITDLLKGFGLRIARKQFDHYLFLLQSLKFFRKTHDGGDDYYVQADSGLKFISYTRSDDKTFDRVRFRADIQAILEERPHYKNRKRVLDAAKKQVQQ